MKTARPSKPVSDFSSRSTRVNSTEAPFFAGQNASGVKKSCVPFKMIGKCAPPRPHYPIWANGANVGIVTSGTQSPSLNVGIGMGYAPPEFAKPATKLKLRFAANFSPPIVVQKPIFRKH